MIYNNTKTESNTGLLLVGLIFLGIGCYCVASAGYNTDVRIYK